VLDYDVVSIKGPSSFTMEHFKRNKVTKEVIEFMKLLPKGTTFMFGNVRFLRNEKIEVISGPI
jgi:hypothetical protein